MDETVLRNDETAGLGTIRVRHPPGTFALTPASRVSIAAIGEGRARLAGHGIDWGSGVGCVAIAAARIPAVESVIGLEIVEQNVRVARENAAANGVAGVRFFVSDSYTPAEPEGRRALAALEERAGFVVANPPATPDGDGFGWRREMARGAVRYLIPGGVLLVQVSSQYGLDRVRSLEAEAPGLSYDGVAATTDWVPFDMDRPNLRRNVETYARAEAAGAPPFAFRWPGGGDAIIDAREAWKRHRETGASPLSRWQVQRFIHRPAGRP